MSNFDLLDWCQYLKTPLKNVLLRDQTVPHNHKLGLFIYNLEPAYLSGSHWVATYVKDNVIKSDFLRISRFGRYSRKIDFSFISPKHTFR